MSEEQFLKVLGVLYLFEKGVLGEPRPSSVKERIESDLEKKIIHVLSVERALSVYDLKNLLRVEEGEIEDAVQRLEAEGKVVAVAVQNNKIVAVPNDGTLDIAPLKPEEKRWMVINAYGNRDKGLTYAQLYSFLTSAPKEPSKSRGRKEEVLQALKDGPKRYSELRRALSLSKGSFHWTLAELLKEGKIERIERGLYRLTNTT
ncbi:MAG: hypothetical protein QXI60_04070 [Thermofilaceae archaeon]